MFKMNYERLERVKNALLAMQRFQWEQGVTAQAMLELGEKEQVILLSKAAVERKAKDGRLGIMEKNESITDPACIGEALLYAAKETGEQELKDAADTLKCYLLYRAPKTRDGVLYHLNMKNQIWVDAFYMAPPFLAVCGCYDEALKQIKGFRKYLWNTEKKLHSHIWDDDLDTFAREDFWGVGNGWAAAGITRVIKTLPDYMDSDRKFLTGYVTELIDGCLKYQRSDGLFHDVLDDPSTFVETNVGQMISYSIYRGVKAGYIEDTYLKYADKIRESVYKKVDKYGLVQGVCGLPNFDHPGVAPEGQAFFLLMEAAAMDLYNL